MFFTISVKILTSLDSARSTKPEITAEKLVCLNGRKLRNPQFSVASMKKQRHDVICLHPFTSNVLYFIPLSFWQVLQAVGFLHDLGSVQHFKNEFLRGLVVIDPQWIVDAMACVVNVKETPIRVKLFLILTI